MPRPSAAANGSQPGGARVRIAGASEQVRQQAVGLIELLFLVQEIGQLVGVVAPFARIVRRLFAAGDERLAIKVFGLPQLVLLTLELRELFQRIGQPRMTFVQQSGAHRQGFRQDGFGFRQFALGA